LSRVLKIYLLQQIIAGKYSFRLNKSSEIFVAEVFDEKRLKANFKPPKESREFAPTAAAPALSVRVRKKRLNLPDGKNVKIPMLK
jgi:hypothetical protein